MPEGTNTELALGCLAATRTGLRCELNKSRSDAMEPQSSCAGKSILDMIWDELMESYGELKGLVDAGRSANDTRVATLRGDCLGLGRAIAIIVNPYNPNIDAVREECVQRWETLQEKSR